MSKRNLQILQYITDYSTWNLAIFLVHHLINKGSDSATIFHNTIPYSSWNSQI